jgi:hypothetical protein
VILFRAVIYGICLRITVPVTCERINLSSQWIMLRILNGRLERREREIKIKGKESQKDKDSNVLFNNV